MFLSKQEIETRFDDFIEGGNREFIREVSYDLCVGDEIYRSEEKLPEMLSRDKHPCVLIRPGQFALVKVVSQIG